MANRHLSRIIVMQSIYEKDFRPKVDVFDVAKRNIKAFDEECDLEYIDLSLKSIIDNLSKIDEIISKAAPEWPIDQIAKIDTAILRVAVNELLFVQEIPPKVVINEAVEIAKTYGSENSSKFVNGVLGALYKQDKRFEEKLDKDIHNSKNIDKKKPEKNKQNSISNNEDGEIKPIYEIKDDATLLDLHSDSDKANKENNE